MPKPTAKPKSVDALQLAFGKAVKKLRQGREMTQEVLADAAGLHFTYISSVERGERNISIQNISRLASALNVPMSSLMATCEELGG